MLSSIELYNFTTAKKVFPGNSMGLYEAQFQSYKQKDLDRFFTRFTDIPNGTHPRYISIDGGIGPGKGGDESELDLDCAYPIVYPQNVTLYQVDDAFYNNFLPPVKQVYSGFFNTFLDALDGSYCNYNAFGISGNTAWPDHNYPHMDPKYPDKHEGGYKGQLQCGKFEPTNVISISYSGVEFYTPMNYQRRQCHEFMKLGMQGVSVVISSGDDGVSNPAFKRNDAGCLWSPKEVDAHHKNFPLNQHFADLHKPVFSPGFPLTCPYLTTVGATVLPKGAETKASNEIASTEFGSGGGFSNIYPTPDYQKAALGHYFKHFAPPYPYYETTFNKSFSPNGGLYNRAGRGYPDVAANGQKTASISFGQFEKSGGTSASAPIFGALLTRINDHRLEAGKRPVGFVNPALYAHPYVLNDVTEGNNPGCKTKGFNASKGWDPVTGLGTPNFPKMLDFFMSLP
jgi:tripeptidyl-peptidase I